MRLIISGVEFRIPPFDALNVRLGKLNITPVHKLNSDLAPVHVLNNNPISIHILEGHPLAVPVGIK